MIVASELPRPVGAYRILREIGEGGTGIVYLALRRGAHHAVALKVLRLGAGAGSFERRFRAETEHLERLRHPGIAALLDAGSAPMETAAGSHEVPFADRIARGDGPLHEPRAGRRRSRSGRGSCSS